MMVLPLEEEHERTNDENDELARLLSAVSL